MSITKALPFTAFMLPDAILAGWEHVREGVSEGTVACLQSPVEPGGREIHV